MDKGIKYGNDLKYSIELMKFHATYKWVLFKIYYAVYEIMKTIISLIFLRKSTRKGPCPIMNQDL